MGKCLYLQYTKFWANMVLSLVIDYLPSTNTQVWHEQTEKMEPLTSQTYIDKEHRWRGVLTSNKNLYLQLLAATHPVHQSGIVISFDNLHQNKSLTNRCTSFRSRDIIW